MQIFGAIKCWPLTFYLLISRSCTSRIIGKEQHYRAARVFSGKCISNDCESEQWGSSVQQPYVTAFDSKIVAFLPHSYMVAFLQNIKHLPTQWLWVGWSNDPPILFHGLRCIHRAVTFLASEFPPDISLFAIHHRWQSKPGQVDDSGGDHGMCSHTI